MDREASRASQHLAETDVHAHEVLMLFKCLLQEVVAQESERCQYVCPSLHCLVLGDSQVGKTSLVSSLTGERLDTEQTKTQGIEERIVDNEWNTVEFTKGHAIGKFIPYFQESLARSMSFGRDIIVPLSDETKLDCTALLRVITLYALRIKELVSVIVCAATHLHLVLYFMWTTIVFTEVPLSFALEVLQLLSSVFSIFFLIELAVSMRCFLKGIPLFGLIAAYRKGKFLNFKLLDFVGDREYYSYHHLFFGPEALYIIAFNLSEVANEYFRGVSTQIQRLQFWMKSICSRVPHYTQIVLVGTHRENLNDSCIKILNDHLKKFLSEKYCAKVMENDVDRLIFFPVENTLGNKDNGIKELQSKIMCVASEQQKRIIIEHNIPLQWILIQDVIMKLKVNSDDMFCVTVDELQRMIMEDFVLRDKCRLSKDMLKYFHKIGLIIYVDKKQDFDLSNWILVCPEKLIDIFIDISSKPAESTRYRGSLKYDWKLLQRKGILTKQLLQSLLSTVEKEEEAVIAFLEHYGLICPLEYKGIVVSPKCDCDIQPTHFVPSLLPLSANGDKPVWHNNDGDKKFYVFFINFLPEALFHQLLSRAQKNSTLEFPNGETVLYRDAGKFWMNPWLSYELTLIEEEEMIEFHCGPACPSDTCPGHQDDYFTSLPAEEGNGTRRRHVYNIMPGRQGNRAAYLYCENNCLEDELYEWIP
ncbi:putative serine/threonine-protein kinase pats1 [Acropora cervicornis]|uniref:Serine/threonine-protein kinase pats1 n=1 Tax=Acropora cervicornis TaxID=6130 RepID=A0AAD9Q1R8_ACRCE|nr:putative serine/threonine-protein kinase pats1 [Acropora cervicornis]